MRDNLQDVLADHVTARYGYRSGCLSHARYLLAKGAEETGPTRATDPDHLRDVHRGKSDYIAAALKQPYHPTGWTGSTSYSYGWAAEHEHLSDLRAPLRELQQQRSRA